MIQFALHSGANQQFTITENAGQDSFTITSVSSGLVLDISGHSNVSNANLIQWWSHGGMNQQFRFVPIRTRVIIQPVHS